MMLIWSCDGGCACSWHYWKVFSPELMKKRGHNLPHLLYGFLIYTVSIYASFKVQPLIDAEVQRRKQHEQKQA
jgi:hypothetical protein